MEFTDLTKPFTEKQKIESFLYLQNYMLEQTKKKQPFFIGDTNSWTFHFDKMKNDLFELNKTFDFDIALVSCGGFGMILSDYICSELNKSTMYVGGGLQLYFGIIGNRWKTHPIISKLFNEKWCNVLDQDKPSTLSSNPRLCENGCYW